MTAPRIRSIDATREEDATEDAAVGASGALTTRTWCARRGPASRDPVNSDRLVPLDVHLIQRRPQARRASLSASPSPQKCMNNRRGDSFNMWLCNAVTWMPLARSARRTGFTSLAIKTKSPVVAAPVAPVGWILIAVATPIAGGTSRLSTLTGPPRGTPIWYTPPLTRPCAPMISAIWVVSRPKAGAEVGAGAA